MKILVIGPNGFVGSHLTKRLRGDGHTLWFIHRNNFPVLPDALDAVINCAARIDSTDTMYQDNVGSVIGWLQIARSRDARFIQIGSSSETGPVEGLRSETTVCQPSNLYEATKLAATNLCLGYAAEYETDVVVARPFSLYGPNNRPHKMLQTLWRTWKDEKEFVCYPGGHAWLHIDDFVEGIVSLLHTPYSNTQGHIYHFGTGISTQNKEIVSIFNESVGGSGVRVKHVQMKYRLYDVIDWRSDSTKARTHLGWEPKVNIHQGIRRFVHDQWFEEELSQSL